MRTTMVFFLFVITACAPAPATPSTLFPTEMILPSLVPTVTETAVSTPEPATDLPEYLQNIPILTEAPKSWDEVPRVQMADVESGAFAEAIKQAYADGRIEPFGENVPNFTFKLADLTSSIFTKYGYGPLYEQVLAGKPHSDMFGGLFVGVDEDGNQFMLDPQLLKVGNNRGDVGLLIYSFPLSGDQKRDLKNMTSRWQWTRDKSHLMVPLHYKDETACATSLQSDAYGLGFCLKYVREHQAEAEQLIKQWKLTGVFPPELMKMLFLITAVST